MLRRTIAGLRKVVAEVKSPFSYIHDEVVEALSLAYVDLKEMEARIKRLEGIAGIAPPPPSVDVPADTSPEEDHPLVGDTSGKAFDVVDGQPKVIVEHDKQ